MTNGLKHIVVDDDSKPSETVSRRKWGLFKQKPAEEQFIENLEKQFDGGSGRRFPYYKYRRPQRKIDPERVTPIGGQSRYLHRPGQEYWKFEDVDTYLSSSLNVPRRLMVQATKEALQEPDATWRRSLIRGDVPLALRLSEWAIGDELWFFEKIWRTFVIALPLQLLMSLPGVSAPWETDDIADEYNEFEGEYSYWPKHSINPLDMRGGVRQGYERPARLSSKRRLNRPRQLVVFRNNEWTLDPNPPNYLQYVFISWKWNAFVVKDKGGKDDGSGLRKVQTMAEHVARSAGLSAYWLDQLCNHQSNKTKEDRQLLTSDVNRMCDVIRASSFVAIMLPDESPSQLTDWGARMWTLPEGLLAPGPVHVCTWLEEGHFRERKMGKVEMTSQFWTDRSDEIPARTLAEHYDGEIDLSRLELFSLAIQALSSRTTANDFTGADVAYALMGLLHYRIEPDPTDDLFQVMARLSLANDNDRLIERMLSMNPLPTENIRDLFKIFAERDQYQTHFWDVIPKCEIVGISDAPNTVVINEARAIAIRWKRFPRIKYRGYEGFRNSFARFFVRSGFLWFAFGMTYLLYYAPSLVYIHEVTNRGWNRATMSMVVIVSVFFGIGIALSALAPKSVRFLFAGDVLESAPHLVGFEGVMPIEQLEKIVYGNCKGRLSYEASSTPYNLQSRDPEIRQAIEPKWITDRDLDAAEPPLNKGFRLFTLVDTGNLTVSIFQARHPPTVALVCGSEGGMARAVLCSWRFANDCLYKESVIRVPSHTYHLSKPAGWLQVSLNSQGDIFHKDDVHPAVQKARDEAEFRES